MRVRVPEVASCGRYMLTSLPHAPQNLSSFSISARQWGQDAGILQSKSPEAIRREFLCFLRTYVARMYATGVAMICVSLPGALQTRQSEQAELLRPVQADEINLYP
jgi:hypothetical protein